MKIVFATGNIHKAKEVADMLPSGFELVSLTDLGFTEDIPETGSTLQENAQIKARAIHSKFKLPVFADDTGLEVEALNGAPGVYSARYAGENATFEDNCNKLLEALRHIDARSAQFRTVFCFIDENADEHFFEGRVEGSITRKPAGEKGFGYDPIFKPANSTGTYAEMSASEKNKDSHRSRALKKLLEYLENLSMQS